MHGAAVQRTAFCHGDSQRGQNELSGVLNTISWRSIDSFKLVYTCINIYISIYHISICTYIHTYMHAYIHTYMHTYIHTYLHAYVLTYVHIYLSIHLSIFIFRSTCWVGMIRSSAQAALRVAATPDPLGRTLRREHSNSRI